ncbi:YSIRK-type signal peptide-containing protein [Staphylococcus saprophyticus]|uniref:YSIRK-type signal peptide-containing protein n=1 Tax=Staphylococcus saprophyticus TaxID=29385 RepID=UPI003FD7B034
MDKRQNKYSIRKFTFGASSILIGSLLFLGVGTAQAAEEDHHTETKVQQLNGNQLGNDKQEKLVNETLAIPIIHKRMKKIRIIQAYILNNNPIKQKQLIIKIQ